MEAQIIYLSLGLLAFGLALTLKLAMAARKVAEPAVALEAGETVPAIDGRALAGGAGLTLPVPGQPAALLFLSSRCPKCREKIPELERLLPAARDAGLAIWLVSEEPAFRLRAFLGSSPLRDLAVRTRLRDYKRINPTLLSPAYLFVDHEGGIDAAGFIGDDNWTALQHQLTEERAA